MFVKVTKAPSDKYWYSRYIGEVIEVEDALDEEGNYVIVDWQRYNDGKAEIDDVDGLYIESGDAEVLTEKTKVSIADTWLLVRNDDGKVLGSYDQLRYARQRRTALKDTWETTIVKVAAVEGCEYPE